MKYTQTAADPIIRHAIVENLDFPVVCSNNHDFLELQDLLVVCGYSCKLMNEDGKEVETYTKTETHIFLRVKK